VSIRELAALARRHVFAVCLILLATAGIAIDFRYTPAIYQETDVVAVGSEGFMSVAPITADEDFLARNSLITTCQLLAMHLSGPEGEVQLRRAGVTGNLTVSVVNDSNADMPEYPYPDLSVSVAAWSPDSTHRQSIEAMRVIASDIAAFQANKHLPAYDLIVTYILSDSGPISQRGSLIRTYAALVFLALVAMFCTCRFLDRRSRAAMAAARAR